MGLLDDIQTLEAKYIAGKDVVQELAEAYATMILRKGRKRLIYGRFDDLTELLNKAGRYNELIEAADGVDPRELGAWDVQTAVGTWLAEQNKKEER